MTVGRVLISGLRVQISKSLPPHLLRHLAHGLAMVTLDTTIRDFANRLCQVQVRSQTSDPPRTIGHLSTSVLLLVELNYLSVGRIQSLLYPFMHLLLLVFRNNNNFPEFYSHVVIRTVFPGLF